MLHKPPPPPPLCDIPSGCCSFTGPWTVTRSSLRMLRRVAAFCRPLRPVLLLVSFPRSRSPVVGVLGLCWMRHGAPPPPPPEGDGTHRKAAVSPRKRPVGPPDGRHRRRSRAGPSRAMPGSGVMPWGMVWLLAVVVAVARGCGGGCPQSPLIVSAHCGGQETGDGVRRAVGSRLKSDARVAMRARPKRGQWAVRRMPGDRPERTHLGTGGVGVGVSYQISRSDGLGFAAMRR